MRLSACSGLFPSAATYSPPRSSSAEPAPATPRAARRLAAILAADVVGYSRLMGQDEQGTLERLKAHRKEFIEPLVAEHRGRIVNLAGDSALCEFASVVEAVACAVAIQEGMAGRELDLPAAERIRFRIGVNVGDVIVEGEEIYGDGVNIAARLEGLAEPGGVCVSGKVYDEVRSKLDLGFEDLGERALKNIARPVRVWRVADAGAAATRRVAGLPYADPGGDPSKGVIVDLARFRRGEPRFSVAEHNLPQQVTALVGRAAELAEIKARLDQHRLVTLVGSGGVGKTRLVLQAAADLLGRYPDGVWLVELAPLASPQLVAETVAGMFGLSRSTGRSAVEIVVAFLKEKRTLLLLDNCEHLVDAVAQVAEAILRGCPTVSVLASSRENLAIAGENVYRVPSLDFPEDAEGITAAAALDHAAVRLFADRAGSVVDGFAVTDANAPAIAAICRRLDGVALAIELAVARLTMLKPHELASRLDDRFRLLTGGSRTALPRQQTLRALIDWSYDLLTDPEQTLLRRLSVFAGGWTLDSAATVCADDPVEEREIFDLLASLIDKSLVVADATGDRTRYRLLESTRAYALEKLVESGECSHSRRLAEHVHGVVLGSRGELGDDGDQSLAALLRARTGQPARRPEMDLRAGRRHRPRSRPHRPFPAALPRAVAAAGAEALVRCGRRADRRRHSAGHRSTPVARQQLHPSFVLPQPPRRGGRLARRGVVPRDWRRARARGGACPCRRRLVEAR